MIETIFAALVLVSLSVALYLIPVMVGVARHVPDLGAIAVINVLLGWTFVGWVLALALAMRSVTPAGPVVQLVQNLPPDGGWAELPGAHQPWQAPPLMLPEAPPDDSDETPADWE